MFPLMIWILIAVAGGWVGLRLFWWFWHPAFDGQDMLGELCAFVFTSTSFQLKPGLPERSPEWLAAMKELDAIDAMYEMANPTPKKRPTPTNTDGTISARKVVKEAIKAKQRYRPFTPPVDLVGIYKLGAKQLYPWLRITGFEPVDEDRLIVVCEDGGDAANRPTAPAWAYRIMLSGPAIEACRTMGDMQLMNKIENDLLLARNYLRPGTVFDDYRIGTEKGIKV